MTIPRPVLYLQVAGDILALCEEYVPGEPPEFFFDRNPENFGSILEIYRCMSSTLVPHHLHIPAGVELWVP